MEDQPLTVQSWPRAILHLDADAFFASVEQARDPSLRGRPVVTGGERGIITSVSYEAKALGIQRGVPLWEARKRCPGLVVLSSDYEAYSLYSRRIFQIMRQYTPWVEEYSIDEAFADITGLRRLYRCGYREIAEKMKQDVQTSLGLTVSVGLSLSKSLAKLCSKFRKPDGLTAVEGRYIHLLLQRTPLEKVWGIGPNSRNLLEKAGLRTAYDFVRRPEGWVARRLHKPGREMWHELRGQSVWKVLPEEASARVSVQKFKTFTPATADRDAVYAQLIRNMENAFAAVRRYALRPRRISVVLRRADFINDGLEARLNRPTSSTLEALPLIRSLFGRLFRPDVRYRASGIVLGRLESDATEQLDLFENRLRINDLRRLTEATDRLNTSYGRHTVCSATSLNLAKRTKADALSARRVGIPVLDITV